MPSGGEVERLGAADLLTRAVVRLSVAGDADQSEEFAEGEAREAKAHGHARSHENQFAKCGHVRSASQGACPRVVVDFGELWSDWASACAVSIRAVTVRARLSDGGGRAVVYATLKILHRCRGVEQSGSSLGS